MIDFKQIAQSMIKLLEPFPCSCGGTFNRHSIKDGFPIVVIYLCSVCERKTEQTMDTPCLDEITPEMVAEITKTGHDGIFAKIIKAGEDEDERLRVK